MIRSKGPVNDLVDFLTSPGGRGVKAKIKRAGGAKLLERDGAPAFEVQFRSGHLAIAQRRPGETYTTSGAGRNRRRNGPKIELYRHFNTPFRTEYYHYFRIITTTRIYHEKRQKVKEANTTTPEFLQDAIVADLADLFEGQTLPSSAGDRRPIRVYPQGLPIIEGMDETEDRTEEIPEPYIIVRTNEGNIPDANSPQEMDLILVICVYDNNPNRQGYRDVLHIIQEVYGRYAKNPVVRIKAGSGGAAGGPYSIKSPIKWGTQQDDTHPYYFGAMSLKFEAPAVRQEVPFI